MASSSLVVVITGGDPPDPDLVARLDLGSPVDRRVVGADSGIAHALALGFEVDVAVGDFDSVDPDVLAAVTARGARVERHPVAKDATDLELALDAAIALGARRVVVLGGHGGRLDHFLANTLLLASARYCDVRVEALLGADLVTVVHPGPGLAVTGRPGGLVSILPVHGAAEGVRTEGLRYPLDGETLPAGTTRGVSNELIAGEALVSLTGGTVLLVRPLSTSDRTHEH